MKIYISADIEGITNVTNWDETDLGNPVHSPCGEQMKQEVLAACRGAIAAGATEIFVKDAHGSGRNFFGEDMPEEVTLIRGWTNAPDSMVTTIDNSFDAVIFIGYHSGAGLGGNPLCHTMNQDNNYVKINGEIITEFHLHAYVAASKGVPCVFISGDNEVCNMAKELVPNIETVAVKYGIGNATFNMSCTKACQLIQEGVKNALTKPQKCILELPDTFEMEINFKEPVHAYRSSFYPGAKQIDPKTVTYVGHSVDELMTARMFML